ncbi:LOW QUALITY PROTEIN: checkpoint protein HUS1B [Ursus arctos]|uniref:LOW QUALITY PROTEIN: checkpoint protein HUS1B n=1 Tax=Ursus arctos TaxID=9644 RepID=UPI000E6DDDC2|nr:LOW QUALITY PROTEIN: checkpoint protein HUS1B [Ursus arctos]
MKFCANVIGKDLIELFIHISGTISKLARVFVLHVFQDSLCFRPDDSRVICDARVWCEVRRGDFFHRFHVEDVSEELKEIYLELTSEHLFRTASSTGNASTLKPQLTNKWRPHLTVSVELPLPTGWTPVVILIFDGPIRVLPPTAWEDFPEPGVEACDVSVNLLSLKTLKSSVERIANLGDQMLVEANLNGKMNLSIETDAVSIKSYFNNLGNPPKSAQDMPQDRNLENMVQVLVESRKLLQFFEGQQINPVTALCNVLSNTLLHLVLVHEDVSLQCFIPAS